MADVSVIGLGRLGLPLAVLLSARGLKVVGVDADPGVVHTVNARKVPERIFEPGLREMLEKDGTLIVTGEIAEAVNAPISIILVPTPNTIYGEFSLGPILDACQGLGAALRGRSDYHVVVVSSTVSPGSCDGPIAKTLRRTSGRTLGADLGLCYSPEMVALGSVMSGFSKPDFVLIGESDPSAGWRAAEFYRRLCAFPSIRRTNLVNAELAKIALNCYVAMKITFANELAELCERFPGSDVDVVTQVLGLDSRISGNYLKGAAPYGGLCFPRDTSALTHTAESTGVRSLLMDTVAAANRWQMRRLILLVENFVKRSGAKTVGILGLAFKPGTNVIKGSAGEALLRQHLLAETVIAFDPIVQVGQSVKTAQACVDRADMLVITTPDSAFRGLEFRAGQTVIDCWRLLDRETVVRQGAEYVAIGVGSCEE